MEGANPCACVNARLSWLHLHVVSMFAFVLCIPAVLAADDDLLGLPPSEGQPLRVGVAFYLWDINDVDDDTETFELSGVLVSTWKDPRQAFDIEAAGVREKVFNGGFQFSEMAMCWYPQVVLANVAGLCDRSAVVFRVKSDGTCRLVEKVNAIVESKLNLRSYPFDRQQLKAVFTVLDYGSDAVKLECVAAPRGPQQKKIRIPQWELLEISGATEVVEALYLGKSNSASALLLSIDVRRKSFYVVRLVVVPLLLIVILSWSVFWMDRGAPGDRFSVSFVGILTVVAYQMVVGDILPRISYVTFIHGFLNISFLLMCSTIPINLWIAACERKGAIERAMRIDKLCRWGFPVGYAGLVLLAAVFVYFF